MVLNDYKIDVIADIKLVAKSMNRDLNEDQLDTIALTVLSNYSFNEWIEKLIEDM